MIPERLCAEPSRRSPARIDRRRFLGGAGSTAAVGLAGCLGGGGGGGGTSTITLGLTAPFFGRYGFDGYGQQRGRRLAFEEITATDAILPDAELEHVTDDTKTYPEVGLSAARDLVLDEQVDHQCAGPIRAMQLVGADGETAEWEILDTLDGADLQEPGDESACRF